jgi:hypothetical protein
VSLKAYPLKSKNAAMQGTDLSAALGGTSPAMVHQHYKGLSTKAEGEAWFKFQPLPNAENVIAMPATKNI